MTNIGNKAAGGGSEVSATPTSITIDGVTVNLAQYTDPSEGGTKLLRVDDGVTWEAIRPSSGSISAFSNGPATKVTITSAAHGQREGATVVIAGTTDYDGTFVISNVTDDTFDIIETWNITRTGTFTADNGYYAPAPFSAYGTKAKTRRYTSSGVAGAELTLIASGIAAGLSCFGWYADSATGYNISYGSSINTAFGASVAAKAGALTLQRGTSCDDATDGYDLIAIYLEA